MRKFAIFLAAAFVLSLAATAFAAQANKYSVSGSTSPTTAGSKSKPKAIGIKFGYTVSEAAGQRPAVVEKYAIKFAGTRVNPSVAAKCSSSVLESQGPSGCPAKSIVGNGFIENQTGNRNDPNDKSVPCNASLTVVNLGSSKASIYVQGDPSQSDPRKKCAIQLAASIPAKFTNASSGSTLSFTVPESLKHPLPTLSNAVVNVSSTIKKVTKGGKGFYESIGGCKSKKRTISVQFTTEDGQKATSSKQVACK